MRLLVIVVLNLFFVGIQTFAENTTVKKTEDFTLNYNVLANEMIMGDQPVVFSFQGTANTKIRLGASFMYAAIKINTPSGTVLYNQSYDFTPENGLVLEYSLIESGEYKIELTPQMGFLQIMMALYKMEPIEATPLSFGEESKGTLNNWGIIYYSFQGTADDIIDLTYTGGTNGFEMYLITPGGNTIPCDDDVTNMQIAQSLTLSESGAYTVVLNSLFPNPINFTLYASKSSNEIETIPYTPGDFLSYDLNRMEKQNYVFEAHQGDRLRVGLTLPNAALQIYQPDGTLMYNEDHTDPLDFNQQFFNNRDLTEDGEYRIAFWHNYSAGNSYPVKFCASFIDPPETITLDSTYSINVPAYQMKLLKFNAQANQVLRLYLPYGTALENPSGEKLVLKQGELFEVVEKGEYEFGLTNFLEENSELELWVNSVTPPDSVTPVNIGETVEGFIDFYNTKSISYSATKGDTVFLQASLIEYVLNPTVNNIKASNAYLYITMPNGNFTKLKGSARGMLGENAYAISYYFKDQMIFEQTGTYYFTTVLDKMILKNPTYASLRLDKSGAKISIPYHVVSDYELPGIYSCNVPDGLNELFVIVKKNNFIAYDATWRGNVTLEKGDLEWKSVGYVDERDDFIFIVENPEAGEYSLPITANNNDEIRGSILFTNQLPEATLNSWNSGVVSRPYGSDWKFFEIGEGIDTLYFESEGFGLWSTIEITYNTLDNKGQRWIFQNMGSGYHIQGKIPNPLAGRYFIRYIDSAVIQDNANGLFNHSDDQTKEYLVYVGAVAAADTLLSIQKVATHTIGQGEASLVVEGTGFMNDQQVYLVNDAETDTFKLAIGGITDNRRELIASANFAEIDTGKYELEILASDTLVRYNKSIEVIPAVNVGLDASMMTSDLYRLGRKQKCILRIKNNGNTDIPFAAGCISSSNEKVNILLTENLFLYNDADSLNDMSSDYIFNEIPFFIRNLKVGQELELIYKIQSSDLPDNEEFDIEFTVGMLSAETYYAFQDTMAENCYNFMLNEPSIPESMKDYLQELTLNGFIAVWNEDDPDLLKSSFSVKEEEYKNKVIRLENGRDWFTKHLDWTAGKVLKTGDGVGPSGSLLSIISNPYNAAKAGVNVLWNQAKRISGILNGLNTNVYTPKISKKKIKKKKKAVNSTTPEDKYGPIGYGMEHGNGYITELDEFEYRVDYWNKEDASAPAAIVYIRDTIDEDFNLKTFQFTEIGFLKWKLPLDGGQYFNVNIDCRPEMPYIVSVEGTVDYDTREVYWVHTTLDPETMELPDDPLSGYLPPIDSTGYQMGWVSYTIKPKDSIPNNTAFENQAFVNFDGVGKWGPAPPYGPYTNIFDVEAPVSYVKPLPENSENPTFDIELAGTDNSGVIDHFDLYVSKDNEGFEFWKSVIDTVVSFTGIPLHRYQFYSIATDAVGNVETDKNNMEAETNIIIIDGLASMEKASDQTIKIVPNPNNGQFKLLVDDFAGSGELQVYTSTGKSVVSKRSIETNGAVDLSELSPGIYLVQLKAEGKLYRKKLSIMR